MSTLHIPLDALRAVKTSSVGLDFQNEHRLNLLQSWLKITKDNGYDLSSKVVGKQTLDIGCGQGDMIAIFAAVLQAQGNQQSKVTGVDPASPDYGTPFTLGDAQSRLSTGPLGEYLCFKQSTAPALVASEPLGTYTTAYFAHSLYYFPSVGTLVDTFKSLLDAGVEALLLAEWSLSISQTTALPHLLAVLLQSLDPLPDGNVRTVLSPSAYIEAATQAGWEIVGSRTFTPTAGLEDGRWETGFARTVAKNGEVGKQAAGVGGHRSTQSVRLESMRAHADALEDSISSEAGVEGVECMDVWTAVFRPARRADGPRPA